MRLPTLLSRHNKRGHKNTFGHVLILAGSKRMLGAAALAGLASMRSGAGLVTIGTPKSLNETLQRKISPVIMTWPLPETKDQTLSLKAFNEIKKTSKKFQAIALGPGLSQNPSTQKLILKIISSLNTPLVIDADGLNALAMDIKILTKGKGERILTPHVGEMTRLTKLKKQIIEKKRSQVACDFAKKYRCVLLLKGHQTVVASPQGEIHINKTGNAGLATAGSGDVLTGMIAAFLGQGLSAFESAKWAALIHGKAGDLIAERSSKISLIATDLIEILPLIFKNFS